MKSVLVIEGQFNLPVFLQNQLIKPFMREFPGSIEPTYIAWHEWLAYRKDSYDIVVGHSLGGQSVIDMVNDLAGYFGALKTNFISVDPRHQSNAGWFDTLLPIPFRTLSNFKVRKQARIHNFYRWGYMPGYPVNGAIENTQLSTTHFTAPGAPQVYECFKRLVGV